MVYQSSTNWSYLGVSSTLLGGIEHLQGGLGHGLRLVQESHLLLVVIELGGHTHRGYDEWFKVTSQLCHLRQIVKYFHEFSGKKYDRINRREDQLATGSSK